MLLFGVFQFGRGICGIREQFVANLAYRFLQAFHPDLVPAGIVYLNGPVGIARI